MAYDVPTYQRPEPLCHVVETLNQYYADMVLVVEWEAEAKALRESVKRLTAHLASLEVMPTVRLTSRYGLTPGGGGDQDAGFKAHREAERERVEVMADLVNLRHRANELCIKAYECRGKWTKVTMALSKLTDVQRQVVEARHRDGVRVLALAHGLSVEQSAISHAYGRALASLAEVLG